MDRESALTEWKKLQYLRDICRVQYQHKGFIQENERFLLVGHRYDDTVKLIQQTRAELSRTKGPKAWMQANKTMVSHLVLTAMGIDYQSRRNGNVSLGGRPNVERKTRQGAYFYHVRVGHMWLNKVYNPLYQRTDLAKQGSWLILTADKVRVNDKLVSLYEVTAYNYETNETARAYVAQAKTEKRQTAFGKTAKLAVARVNDILSDELDKALLGQED